MSLEKDTWTHFIRRKKTVVGEKQYKQNNQITYFGRRKSLDKSNNWSKWSLPRSWQELNASMLPKEIKTSFLCKQQSSPASPHIVQLIYQLTASEGWQASSPSFTLSSHSLCWLCSSAKLSTRKSNPLAWQKSKTLLAELSNLAGLQKNSKKHQISRR